MSDSSADSGAGPTRQLLARVPESLHRAVRKLALDENTTMAALVEEALVSLLEGRDRADVDKADG